MQVLNAFSEGPPRRRLLTLSIRRQRGRHSIGGTVLLDNAAQAHTPFVTIADAPHSVEIDWTRASSGAACDGRFALWIDGRLAAEIGTLCNREGAVDFVRMGAMGARGATPVLVHLDEFESRRQSYIGPVH